MTGLNKVLLGTGLLVALVAIRMNAAELGPAVSLSSTSLTFGYQNIATNSAPQTVTLTNTGDEALAIADWSVTSDFTQSNTCPKSLPPAESCAMKVTFTPSTEGLRTGFIMITDTAADSPQFILLRGTGVDRLTLSAPQLDFGEQPVSTNKTQPLTLSNDSPVAIPIISIETGGGFLESNNCGSSLAPKSTCTVQVTFAPAIVGTIRGTLTITGDFSDSPLPVSLTGVGTTPNATPTAAQR